MFVAQMYGVFQDRTNVFIILRYEENGSLLDFINRNKKLTIDCAQGIITEVILGLQVLHHQNILHGDVKPENIILDKNLRAHITDFGLSLKVDPKYHLIGHWGTAAFQSPEQLLGNVPWDHTTVYFNVGVVFLLMVTGQHPFGRKEAEIQRNVAKLRYEMPQFASSDTVSFVKKMLCLQADRLNCISVLRHPFVSSIIEKVKRTYDESNCAVILSDDNIIQPYYDNVVFFAPIPDVPFESEEPEEVS